MKSASQFAAVEIETGAVTTNAYAVAAVGVVCSSRRKLRKRRGEVEQGGGSYDG